MGKKKMIENYQILQVVGEIQGKYEIIKAKHVQQKKYYTLKKVKIKNDKNNQLYQGFLNQASLLKGIKHHNIAKSIKMMKTATSIYVVYDYCEGQNLEEWMQNGSKKTIAEKQGIVKQLLLVLVQMRKSGITHLYLNPESIYVSQDGDVKVTDFMYGIDMPQIQGQIEIQYKIPKTEYTAPEVKKSKATFQSDIYSFGKIVEFMDFTNSKKGSLSTKQFNTKSQEYNKIAKNCSSKKAYDRDSIQQIYKVIFKTKGKLKKMNSLSMSLSKIGGKQSMMSRNSQITTATGRQKSGQFVQQLILKILKRRNMSRLLIEIFKNIVDASYINSTDQLILVTLLLKKSTIILNSIGKFMKYGKGIQGMQLNQRDRNRFFKSGDYFKLLPILQSEIKLQKKQFELTIESIYLDNVKILQNKQFNAQLKKQELDQNYLKQIMKDFIINSVNQMDLVQEHSNYTKALYIMSQIIDHAGIELFFEKKINTYPIELNQQAIFIKIYKQMKVLDLIMQLQKYRKAG